MKKLIDLFFSILLLLILAPVMALVSMLVLFFLGRPVFFVQERIGQHNIPFKLIKFRSMAVSYSGSKQKDDEERTNVFGRWLRRSSLDELPELLNVILGDMSLVGPRPLLPEYLPRYDKTQIRRHEVKPGLTGWAQVNGRNKTTWRKRFELDVWYVDHQSVLLDCKILLLTLVKVVRMQGVDGEETLTMPEFRGNDVEK